MIIHNAETNETWEPSKLFRWKRSDGILGLMEASGTAPRTLQQQWFRHGDYKTEWRDVPTQQEGEE